jgi:hypothetical protein
MMSSHSPKWSWFNKLNPSKILATCIISKQEDSQEMESSREEKQEATRTWPCISMEKQIAAFICDPSHFI